MWLGLLTTLMGTVILGYYSIPLLQKLKFGQTVRDDGPQSHLKKMGTPTMGGLFFLIPILLGTALFSIDVIAMLPFLLTILGFAIVGFIDDWIKIQNKSKDGFSVLGKTVALLVVCTTFSYYWVFHTPQGNEMVIPFSGMSETWIVPSWLYFLFLILFLYLISNSVNLLDGVDGLCSGVTMLVLLFFFSMSQLVGGFANMDVLMMCLVGGLLGFLVFNIHPAKVFMGDVGSLALGGSVGIIAIAMGIPWIILIVGIIYVIEALSVIIQVGHYKRTKKRVFKMAPIHHHYELKGWSEKKIVLVFSGVTLVSGVLSLVVLGLL